MELTYEVRLRTRSTDRDYFWVGTDPDEWWMAWSDSKLRRAAALVRDVSSAGDRLYLTSVVSGRRDGSGSRTPIRYEIALTQSSEVHGISAGQVRWLINSWWQERGTLPNAQWRLGRQIDAALESAAKERGLSVDELLESRDATVIATALASLPEVPERTPFETIGEPSWIGSEHPEIKAYLGQQRSVAYFAALPLAAAQQLSLRRDVLLVIDGDAGIHPRFGPKAVVANRDPKAVAAYKPRQLNGYQARLWLVLALVCGMVVLALVVIL